MKPIRYDPDGVPLFSSRDIDDYGLPELYNYQVYRVVESRDLAFVTDYNMEQQREWRKIHRYSRQARFRTTLLNLVGERGKIPVQTIQVVKTYLKPQSKDLWNDTRSILKHFKMGRFYDNIPIILKQAGYKSCFSKITATQIRDIIRDFKMLSSRYDNMKTSHSRVYFPNIRFVVLKLLERHGFTPKYKIPLVRTVRKKVALNKLWDSMVKDLEPIY